MFVRWKKRKRFDKRLNRQLPDYLYAVLVESIRVNGEPRQKTIKYLGSIFSDLVNAPFRMSRFWVEADKNLSELDLSPAEREKIINDMKKVVPLPSENGSADKTCPMGPKT
jgi:hypothetical protein